GGRIWLWTLPVHGDFHFNSDETARVIAVNAESATVILVVEAFSGQLVPVTAGEHVIEQRLRPWDAALGAVITGATLMVRATCLWVSLFRDRRRREVEPAA
ncbi:MAG TPA: hypothetical protein VIA02_00110, partial [Candidatus Limnocylindria bacterium]